jgi:hypothetical protein
MNFTFQYLTDCQELILLSLCLTIGIISWQGGRENPLPTLKNLTNKIFDPHRIKRGAWTAPLC